jgi:DnaJ-class molecular chaperone
MPRLASYPSVSAGLAQCGITIESAEFAPAGQVFVSSSGNKYYCVATYTENGISYRRYFMAKEVGRKPAFEDARVVAGRALLTAKLRASYPCERCGGSGIWTGHFRGICFGCNGHGFNTKYLAAKWALPTTY